MRFFFLLLVLVFCVPIVFADEVAPDPVPPPAVAEQEGGDTRAVPLAKRVYISFQILDDDTIFVYFNDGRLKMDFGDGPDDAFTYALRLEFAWLEPVWIFHRIRGNVTLNCYTRRNLTLDSGYRMDFLSALFWGERDYGIFSLGGGLGAIGRGNFGGGLLQNAFHRLINTYLYLTPYIDPSNDKLSPLVAVKARLEGELFQALGFKVNGALYTRGVWDVLAAGRSSLWLGTEVIAAAGVLTLRLGGGGRLSSNGGDAVLTQVFSSGIFLIGKMSIRLGDFTLGFGVAFDPYGSEPLSPEYYEYEDNRQFIWSISYGDASRADPLDLFTP